MNFVEEKRHFFALGEVTLANGEVIRQPVYSCHVDSHGEQDTPDSIEQIVGDLMQDAKGFDAPVDGVEILCKRLIDKIEYGRAPRAETF